MSIRVNSNLTLKERKVHTFDNFKGVDFTTSPHKVASYRSPQAKNLIYEGGTVRKRHGWESVLNLPDRINGLFHLDIEGEKILLCYAGKKFYALRDSDLSEDYDFVARNRDITHSSTYPTAAVVSGRLVDRRIQVFTNGNKAYIVGCGDYLVCGKWGGDIELRRVYNNEDTYIPTTTINIDEDSVNDENRAILDGVNILTPKRKNEFLGVDADSGTWTVDTAIKGVEQAIDYISPINITLHTYAEDGETPISIEIGQRLTYDMRQLYKLDDNTLVGSVDFTTGKITLNINTKPQEEDTANIIVTFEKSVEGQEDIVANATIGIVFGGGGASNRLFLGGNSKQKNVHVWSEMYDYTYFPDTNFDKVGNDGSGIVGYTRVADGTLLAFKERNGNDSTVYYITGTDTQEEDFRGDPVFISKFFKTAGEMSDTVFGKYATANLNGDNLILTRNGVRSIWLRENIAVNSYNLQERGRNINGKLLTHANLSDACAFVYKDKYYLSVDETVPIYDDEGNLIREERGVVYIADSRFTFESEDDVSGSFNYEWWYWTNVDARVWCEVNGELWFGASDGSICKFNDGYMDVRRRPLGFGDLLVQDGKIVYNKSLSSSLSINDGLNLIKGEGEWLYASLLFPQDILQISDDWVYVSEENIFKIREGKSIYFDIIDSVFVSKIEEVDLDNLRFKVLALSLATSGKNWESGYGMMTLVKRTGGIATGDKILFIASVDKEKGEFQVKEFENGEPLYLIVRNSILANFSGWVLYRMDISAEWYTPIIDLGTNMFSKTLFNVTVATEPLEKGSIVAGYRTRNLEKDFSTKGTRKFDFNDISFEDFSFEGSFASSFTLRAKERNFNYIVIRYVSDNKYPCAVNSISIRYKINRINKGVR